MSRNQDTSKRIGTHGATAVGTSRGNRRREILYLMLTFVALTGVLVVVVFSAYPYDGHESTTTTQLNSRYWFSGRGAHKTRILSDEEYIDRYLGSTDDDRHDNGPDGQDATNGPTVFGFTKMPSSRPSRVPSPSPTARPSQSPFNSPSKVPSRTPSGKPTFIPSFMPSSLPSSHPTPRPSVMPSQLPSGSPEASPSQSPSGKPTSIPSAEPNLMPSEMPSGSPEGSPSQSPTGKPTSIPSLEPSLIPSRLPSGSPEGSPSQSPSLKPTNVPSTKPSLMPSGMPSGSPEVSPSQSPTGKPTNMPSTEPSFMPSRWPSGSPEVSPSQSPSQKPTDVPSAEPSRMPSRLPSDSPEESPSWSPSGIPTHVPTKEPSVRPSASPTSAPSTIPTVRPSMLPSHIPSGRPTSIPSVRPTGMPSVQPSGNPTRQPSVLPSSSPSLDPCKGYDGSFGNTGENEIVISFMYGIESDRNIMSSMPATLSDQIKEVEQALLDLLVQEYFPDCDLKSNNGQRQLNTYTKDDETIRDESVSRVVALEDTIIGLKSSPVDLANGKKCAGDFANDIQYDADCNTIDGKMTVYLSDMVHAKNVTSSMLSTIKSIMDDKLLDDCHLAVLRVMYIEFEGSRFVSDDNFEVETISPRSRGGMWMIALGGVVVLLVIVVGTRYRYSSQFKDDWSGELKDKYRNQGGASDEFVEVRSV